MRNFRTLEVWRKAHQLTLDADRHSQRYPRDELYGLVSQLRRSTASIACNLVEGAGRRSSLVLARFVDMAAGSTSEADCQLLLSCDLG